VRQGDARFSYGDLSRAARGVSVRLAKAGIAPGDVIGIAGAECFGRVVALVGALRHGAVVLPLDESLPPLRRERMLEEANAKLILTLDDAEALELRELDSDEGSLLPPDSPAYVFFTSGTTGTPKGVLGRHNGLAHFLDWQSREFGVGASDRTGQLTSFSFDVVLRAILLSLVSGATLCLPDTPNVRVLAWLKREKVSLLHLVPTLAEAWLAEAEPGLALPDMRVLFFAGEPLGDSLVARYRKLCPNAEIVNLYGPTETTLAKCFARVPVHTTPGAQAVGRPMPGTQALVLEGKRLCGIGEPGDVVIRTPHRSLGYLNAVEETRKKFVENPFGSDADDLVYLTGDRGYYLPDGSLQLLGRSDDQTKVWGVRVEPQEIASALGEHPSVQSAFVTLVETRAAPRLVAYVVAQGTIETSTLIAHARERLPAAVVPSAFVFLPALPVGANGKIDRSQLPAPELAASYEAPRTHAEETIARVWQEVLGVERVGIRDGFFALGGHSLLAARAVARIRELLGIELPVRALFEYSTVEALARHIGEQRLSELDESELGALLDAIEGES
jgi:amino acid adenylation domain-containing protein